MSPIIFDAEPRNILLIKPSSLGDVTHALPILSLLRRRFAGAKIAWMLSGACAGLLEGHPQLDEIILFDRKRLGAAWKNPSAARDLWRFDRALRGHAFDLVVDLQGLFRSGWLAWRTRAPVRIGFENAREGAWLFYTHRVPIHTPEQHAIDRYLAVAEALGCGRDPVAFQFHVTDADRAHIDELLPPATPFAVLMPGTNWPTKRWPAERFSALVGELDRRFGLQSVVAGAADAADLAPQIGAHHNLAGRTTLRQLVALLQRASLVVANDSGPMHIAAALGRPLVTMFGPTNPIRTGPYRRPGSVVQLDIACAPCYSRRCSHQSCLRQLDVDPVLEAAGRELARHARADSATASAGVGIPE